MMHFVYGCTEICTGSRWADDCCSSSLRCWVTGVFGVQLVKLLVLSTMSSVCICI
jgi:hypothetical protein